jgi:hypothetical protein
MQLSWNIRGPYSALPALPLKYKFLFCAASVRLNLAKSPAFHPSAP